MDNPRRPARTSLPEPSGGFFLSSVLAILSAVAYGSADFLGGLASRRSSPMRVVAVSQLYGLILIAVLLPFFPPDAFLVSDLLWGAAAGIVGGVGLVALYRGLSQARMGVVAPVAAGVGATIPGVFGLLSGERPSVVASAGVVVALVAIFVIGWPAGPAGNEGNPLRIRDRGIPEAIIAGTGFGAFFIFLSNASVGSGIWPLLGARLGSLVLLWLLLAALGGTVSLRDETNPLILGAGLVDVTANALFLYATRSGLLTLVAVLSSLYPASTVLLARVVLNERLSRLQKGGVALTLIGMALIAAG